MSQADFSKSMLNETPSQEIDYEKIAFAKFTSWTLTGSVWPVVVILISYLAFVLKIGPDYMKNREPLKIKKFLLVYNLFQAVANAYMLSNYFIEGAIPHLIAHCCRPMEKSKNPYRMIAYNNAWFFLLTKILDLLDTIFFVLRKKQSHVTFLHIYHHTCMVFFTWFISRNFLIEPIVIGTSLNIFVHVIMYSYYFLAALGPQMQKYLWWKIYLTKLQIVQFVIFLTFLLSIVLSGCDVPSTKWILIAISQLIVFLTLFGNFYYKTYISRKAINSAKSTDTTLVGEKPKKQ